MCIKHAMSIEFILHLHSTVGFPANRGNRFEKSSHFLQISFALSSQVSDLFLAILLLQLQHILQKVCETRTKKFAFFRESFVRWKPYFTVTLRGINEKNPAMYLQKKKQCCLSIQKCNNQK